MILPGTEGAMNNRSYQTNVKWIALPVLIPVVAIVVVSIVSLRCKKDGGSGKTVTPLAERTSGYLDMSDWEKARHSITIFEGIIKNEFDRFQNACGITIQYRDFDQYEQALRAALKVPATIDALAVSTGGFARVRNYPEIDEMRGNLDAMIPHLRNFSRKMTQSIEAHLAGKNDLEKTLIDDYTRDYRNAMALFRKVFDIYAQVLTRGARTESQKLTGAGTGGPSLTGDFRKLAGSVALRYGTIMATDIPVLEKYAAAKQYDRAIEQSEKVYTSVRALIMELNWLNPGNEKTLWDGKTSLVSALSYRMMEMTKQKEYLARLKAGDAKGADETRKVLDICRKSANDEWSKFRRMRF